MITRRAHLAIKNNWVTDWWESRAIKRLPIINLHLWADPIRPCCLMSSQYVNIDGFHKKIVAQISVVELLWLNKIICRAPLTASANVNIDVTTTIERRDERQTRFCWQQSPEDVVGWCFSFPIRREVSWRKYRWNVICRELLRTKRIRIETRTKPNRKAKPFFLRHAVED